MVDEILLNETQKVCTSMEAPDFLDFGYDENDLYQVEKLVLKRLKKKFNDVSMCLNSNRNFHMGLKIEMILCLHMTKN